MWPPQWAPVPTPASRADWKAARHAYQEQRRLAREQWHAQWGASPPPARRDGPKSVGERVRGFRRSIGGYGAVVAGLGAVNALTTPWFPWFLFPAVGMGIPILIQLGGLWADHVSLGQIFGKDAALPPDEALARLAQPDVLVGAHGAAVRAAVEDERVILETVGRLQKIDKEMLPEVAPTVRGLVQRVVAVATALTRLDADIPPGMLEAIEMRLTAARQGAPGADTDRKVALLDRQRATIAELIERRAKLAVQLESASLMIGSIKLDLLKLRSAGMGASVSEVTNATQEARALSRDIGYALDAADEVRQL